MKKISYILLLFLLLTACSNEKVHVVYPSNNTAELEHELEIEINEQESVKGFKSVVDNNDLLVAIDIKRMSRFNKEKIENKVTKELEKKFPGKIVLVTADLKIKWEIEKIIEKNLKTKKLRESIEQIKLLSKEET